MPKRIEATDDGKEIVKYFIGTCKERLKIEHPDRINDLASIMLSTTSYFMKYLVGELVDEKTGKNSFVYTYGEMSDGQRLYTHNLLSDKDFRLYVKSKEQFALEFLQNIHKGENNV